MTQPTPTVAVSALELAQHLEGFKSSSHTLDDGTPLHLAAARELRRLAELDRLAATGWQTIDSAPKDGTSMLVWPPLWTGGTISCAYWNTDKYSKKPRPFWKRLDDMGRVSLSRDTPPTLWQHLPPPPTLKEQTK